MPPTVKIDLRATSLSASKTLQVLRALRQVVKETEYRDELGDRTTYLLSLSTYNFPDGVKGSSLLIGATFRLYANSPEELVAKFREWCQ